MPSKYRAGLFPGLISHHVRIIKDFYLDVPDLAKRPKVFGMTASPVDARVDVVRAAK